MQSVNQTVREKLFGTNEVDAFSNQRVRPINGRMPINSEYAGKVYTFDKLPDIIKSKYPNLQRDYQHGIPFTGTGHPDFSRYARSKVDIEFSGSRIRDENLANRLLGYKETPAGFTWHHHHNGKSMQLIPTDLHDAIRHAGGFAKIKS
ncbi:MAG: hypothetical protein NEHIOOID_01342 [Holosporales bacterium]